MNIMPLVLTSFPIKMQQASKIHALYRALRDRGIVLTQDRGDWLRVMFSLRQLGDAEGLPLFHLFSAAATNYDQRECDRQWRKMRSSGQSGRSCTLATLYDMAAKAGLDLKEFARQWHRENPEVDHGKKSVEANGMGSMGNGNGMGMGSGMGSMGSSDTAAAIAAELRQRQQEAEAEARQRRLHPDVIPYLWVERTHSGQSTLVRGLVGCGILTAEQAAHAVSQYRLGALRDGSTLFWYIDERYRAHNAKAIAYGTDCHRLKTPGRPAALWIGTLMRQGRPPYCDAQGRPLLPPLWQSQPCLFGQHLLAHYPERPVAIVESEKTALICSELMAERGFIWLACGGQQSLRPELFEPLMGRTVMLWPDTDVDGHTYRHWLQIAHEAQRFTQRVIRVCDTLEQLCSPSQKQRKVDIADLLIEPFESDQLRTLIGQNPAVAELIDVFGLTEVPE